MKTQNELATMYEAGKHDELVRICAETCYGWFRSVRHDDHKGPIPVWKQPLKNNGALYVMDLADFNPLAHTEAGRSQAFELSVKFNCLPKQDKYGYWQVLIGETGSKTLVEHKDPQVASVIAAILTAQGEIK